MDNRLEILRAFEAFLRKQPHIKEDFVNSSMNSVRSFLNEIDKTESVANGVTLLISAQDEMWKQAFFNI